MFVAGTWKKQSGYHMDNEDALDHPTVRDNASGYRQVSLETPGLPKGPNSNSGR